MICLTLERDLKELEDRPEKEEQKTTITLPKIEEKLQSNKALKNVIFEVKQSKDGGYENCIYQSDDVSSPWQGGKSKPFTEL